MFHLINKHITNIYHKTHSQLPQHIFTNKINNNYNINNTLQKAHYARTKGSKNGDSRIPHWSGLRRRIFGRNKPTVNKPRSLLPKRESDEKIYSDLPLVEGDVPLPTPYPPTLPYFIPAKPARVFETNRSKHGSASGCGKRKTAVAYANVRPGTGTWNINGKLSLLQAFPMSSCRDIVLQPFVVTESIGVWDTGVRVRGGGFRAQAEATRMAIAKALENYDFGFRAAVRAAGFLNRDLRVVERKKPGQPKARKKFQWVRR